MTMVSPTPSIHNPAPITMDDAIASEDGEIVDGAGDAVGPSIDQPDRGITRQLPPRLGQDVQRRLVIVAEQTMRVASEAVSRQAGIENGDLPASTAELQRRGEAGKAAADDDDIIHCDGLHIVDGEGCSCRHPRMEVCHEALQPFNPQPNFSVWIVIHRSVEDLGEAANAAQGFFHVHHTFSFFWDD